MPNQIQIDNKVMSLLISRIIEIKAKGFGDISIYIRNGYIYRVRSSAEDYIQEEDIPIGENFRTTQNRAKRP